jgi:MFS family permease
MKKSTKIEKINEIEKKFSNSKDVYKNTNSQSKSQTKIPSYAWKVLVILSCIATMVMYAETMLIPAIPTLIKDFHISYGLSSWLLTAYLVSGAVMTPIAGKLSDIYGRKKMLLIIMAIYAGGVITGGFAINIYTLIITRVIQGFGMAMFPIAFSMVRDQFPREKVSIAQGVITSMFATGAVIGLSIGGIIIQNFGWRMTFFTLIPISIALLLIIRKFIHISDDYNYDIDNDKFNTNNIQTRVKKNQSIKQEKKSTTRIDIKGSILLAITITSFLLALTLLQSTPSNNNSNINNGFANFYSILENTLPFIILGVISLILFIYVEKRVESPLMDFKIFLKPQILIPSTIIMIVGLSMFMVFQTIPIIIWTNIRNHHIPTRIFKTNYLWFGFDYIRFCNNIAISFVRVLNFNRIGHLICRIIARCRWCNECSSSIFTTRIFWSSYRNEQHVKNSRQFHWSGSGCNVCANKSISN